MQNYRFIFFVDGLWAMTLPRFEVQEIATDDSRLLGPSNSDSISELERPTGTTGKLCALNHDPKHLYPTPLNQ